MTPDRGVATAHKKSMLAPAWYFHAGAILIRASNQHHANSHAYSRQANTWSYLPRRKTTSFERAVLVYHPLQLRNYVCIRGIVSVAVERLPGTRAVFQQPARASGMTTRVGVRRGTSPACRARLAPPGSVRGCREEGVQRPAPFRMTFTVLRMMNRSNSRL